MANTSKALGGYISSPFRDQLIHVVGQFAFEQYFLSGAGMREAQCPGVEGMPGTDGEAIIDELLVLAEHSAFYDLVAPISVVVEQGMTDMLHMHPDLVGPARLQHTLYQGGIAESLQYAIVGDGFFAIVSFRVGVEQ